MNTTSVREIELSGELLEYARATALALARRRCPRFIFPEDVAQEAILQLLAKPPKFDPSKGASEKTLVHLALSCLVAKCAAKERRQASGKEETAPEPIDHRHRTSTASLRLDDFLRFLDCRESRALCRLFVECNGNRTVVARRLGITEGTVRYRLKLLAPKLIAAGFNPDDYGGFQ